ncbi:MAG: aminotransferase class V-fold PLP-dependent enzyme, partial [Solirubrobacteraceae bacterium]|nr:aminotransferase class V-fold PLP-dependent enzyme [Patulibacter sp.]
MPGRFIVPGHKGGPALPEALGAELRAAAALDVPLLLDGVDVDGGGCGSPLDEAQTLAARAWGAGRTWFLTGGATQGNLAACLAVAPRGRRVVVQRSSHSSTFHGLALAGLRPTYALPHVDPALAIAHCVDPATLDDVLAATPEAVAAFVVSPTYYGSAADVAGLAAVAHARGVLLVVDEAWGAHLHFSDLLPQDALAAGADLVISSTHKHLG